MHECHSSLNAIWLALLIISSSSCSHPGAATAAAGDPRAKSSADKPTAVTTAGWNKPPYYTHPYPGGYPNPYQSEAADYADAVKCMHRPLRDPKNGVYPASCKGLAVGRKCQGKCWPGYAGNPSTWCVSGSGGVAVWGPDKGNCVRIACNTQPKNPPNGTFPASCKGLSAGQVCKATCAQFYSGAVNRTCLRVGDTAVGRWSAVQGQCRKITACSTAPDPPTGGSFPSTCAGLAVGQTCTANCSDGYTGLPTPTVKCLATGDWTAIVGRCSAETCSRPTAPAATTGTPNCTVSATSGTETCVYKCKIPPPVTTQLACTAQDDPASWTSTSAACSPEQCSRATRPSEGSGASGTWSCSVSGQLEVCTVKCLSPPPANATVVCNLTAANAAVWKNTTGFCVAPTCSTSTRPAAPSSSSWSCSTSGAVETCTASCPANTGTTAVVVCNALSNATRWDYTQRCLACSTTSRPSPPSGTWNCSTTGTTDTCTAPCPGSSASTTAVCNAAVNSTAWTTTVACPVAPKCISPPAAPDGVVAGTSWTCTTSGTTETCTAACNASSTIASAVVTCDAAVNTTIWVATASCSIAAPTCNLAARPPVPTTAALGASWICSTSGTVQNCTVPCNPLLSSVTRATVTCDASVSSSLWTNSTASMLCPNSLVCTNLPTVPTLSILRNWTCSTNGSMTSCYVLCRWPPANVTTNITCDATQDPFQWTNVTSPCPANNQLLVGTSLVGSNETLAPYQAVCPLGTFVTVVTLNATNNGSIGLNLTCSDGSTPMPWIGYTYNQTAVLQPAPPITDFNWTATNTSSTALGFNKVTVRQASNTSFLQAIGFVLTDGTSSALYGNVTGNQTTLSCAPGQRIVGIWGAHNSTLIGSIALNCTSPCLISTLPTAPPSANGWTCSANSTGDSCRANCPGGNNTVVDKSTVYCSGGLWTANTQLLECINTTVNRR